VLAPVSDVLSPALGQENEAIGSTDRSFGVDPQSEGRGARFGLRARDVVGAGRAAKHFLGLGQVRGNTDNTADVTDDQTAANSPTISPFSAAVDSGAAWTMISLATYSKIDPTQPAVFSPAVFRLLRERLGFCGVVVSDELGNAVQVKSVPAGERSVRFLDAGGDIILTAAPSSLGLMIDAVLARSAADSQFAEKVDAAERRVLQAKGTMGLLQCKS